MNPFQKQSNSYNKIPAFLSGYYALLCLYSTRWFISNINEIPENFVNRPGTNFLEWFDPNFIQLTVNISPLVFFITCMNVTKAWLRVLSFVFTYFSISFLSSQGSNAYTELLPLIWMSFFSIFSFYKREASVRYKYAELVKIHLVIGALVLPYIIAGFWKLLYGGIYQLFWDEISIWNPNALLYTMKTYLLRIESTSWLHNFLTEYPWLIWFSLAYVTFWEISLLFVFWFPKHWKTICLQINIFHFAVIWTLDILFFPQIGLFLLLFFINPLDGGNDSGIKPFLWR